MFPLTQSENKSLGFADKDYTLEEPVWQTADSYMICHDMSKIVWHTCKVSNNPLHERLQVVA
jgi:hypothetical protein